MNTIRMLLLVFALALPAIPANAEFFSDVAKAEPLTLKSGDDNTLETTLQLPKSKNVTYAHIAVVGEVEKPRGKTNASITLSIDDKDVAARTVGNDQGPRNAPFIVTGAVRQALKEGKTSIGVKLSMRGKDQTAYKVRSVTLYCLCDEKYFRNSSYMRPLFSGDEMTAESVFPLASEDPSKPASAKLLFKPTKVLEAYTLSSGKKVDLVQDKDYKIDGDTITFLPGTNVKIVPWKEMYFDTEADAKKGNAKAFYFDGLKKYAFFAEGDWFHKHMVYISYKHTATHEKVGENFDEKVLPKTIAALKAKKPLNVVLYGDSISYGANASGLYLSVPFAPTWGDFVAQELRKYYNAPITFYNRALGGMTSQWGKDNAESLVCPDKPDLVIIAFGMNDRMKKEEFAGNISAIIESVRKANPDAEFILVGSMQANPLWRDFPMHKEYAKALESMETAKIAYADVGGVHERLLKSKRFIDMTGNNVNHPNDFLIRAYAQTILQKLIPSLSK